MVAAGAATGPASGFDLASALAIGGRGDLAALPLMAQVQDGAIRVSGIVTNTADRDAILQIAERVPGVTGVAAAELLVRVPATYTVQSGDSLWMIAERFYGSDLNRVTELYQLNRESLPSAGSVNAGMTLQLPPFD
jgi:nucleoid-associated protein YgaU